MNPVESRATWDDADARLTLGEFSLVQLLVERSPRYVTHREIYDHIRYPGFISGSSEQGYRVTCAFRGAPYPREVLLLRSPVLVHRDP